MQDNILSAVIDSALLDVLTAVSGRQEAGEQLPQWHLRCSRESELQQLCRRLSALHEASLQNVSLSGFATLQYAKAACSLSVLGVVPLYQRITGISPSSAAVDVWV